MRRLLILPALLFAGSAFAADYATCLLDKLPGVSLRASSAPPS